MAQPRTKQLTPSWKHYFWNYLWGLLTVPAFGIGLLVIWYYRTQQKKFRYTISDTAITATGEGYSQNMDLVNVTEVSVAQTWIHEKLDVGTVTLQKEGSEMTLLGIEHPERFAEMLETVITTLQARQKKTRPEPRPAPADSGTMDRVDYLTGLWQQGLISDEDYEREKGHFKS